MFTYNKNFAGKSTANLSAEFACSEYFVRLVSAWKSRGKSNWKENQQVYPQVNMNCKQNAIEFIILLLFPLMIKLKIQLFNKSLYLLVIWHNSLYISLSINQLTICFISFYYFIFLCYILNLNNFPLA